MIHSMTGIGRARGKVGSSFFSIEIKSINHRYCEVHTRFPSRYQSLELQVSQLVRKVLSRGKIDIFLYEDKSAQDLSINEKSLKIYYKFLKKITETLDIKEQIDLDHIQAGMNFWMGKDVDVSSIWPEFKVLVEKALDELVKMRKLEGQNLKKILLVRLKDLEERHRLVGHDRESIVKSYKTKLEKRIEKISAGIEIDPVKLANEVAFLADKADITEELDRLKSHFKLMRKMLNDKKSSGRSMDFLIQEMNREWNTIGSKSQNASIAHIVVEAKSELEKIREQIQNIE